MEELLDVIAVSTRNDFTLELVFEKNPLPNSSTLHSSSRPLSNTAL